MIWGMPSLIEMDSAAENLALCRALGLSFLEVNMNLPWFQAPDLKKLDRPDDIDITVHLPEELNVWDFNDTVRNAYLATMEEIVEVALDKKMKILNMHMNKGIHFTLPNRKVFLFQKFKDRYMENTRHFAEAMSQRLRGTGIHVCIENTGIYDLSFILESLRALLEHDCFKLTWDTGHDHSGGNKDRGFIMNNIGYLEHLHLHDAKGADNHLPLGEGELDIEQCVDKVKGHVKRVVLETKTIAGLKRSVEYLNEHKLWHGRQAADPNKDVQRQL